MSELLMTCREVEMTSKLGRSTAVWDDPRFLRQADRVCNQLELAALMKRRRMEKDADEWIALLTERGIPESSLNTFADNLGDAGVVDSGLVETMEMPVAGLTKTTVYPVPTRGQVKARLDPQPPRLGQHNELVLKEGGVR